MNRIPNNLTHTPHATIQITIQITMQIMDLPDYPADEDNVSFPCMHEEYHPDIMLDMAGRAKCNGRTSLRSDEWLDDRLKHKEFMIKLSTHRESIKKECDFALGLAIPGLLDPDYKFLSFLW